MSSQTTALTTNRLNIKPPTRFWGLALLASGGILAWFLFQRGPGLVAQARATIDFLQAVGADAFRDSRVVSATVLLVIMCIFALVAAFHAVRGILTGMRHMFRFFKTAGIPGQLSNGRTAIRELFKKRTIHFARDTGPASAAGALVPRFRYLTRPQRTLLEALGRSISLWILALALLVSPRFVPDKYLQELPDALSLSEPWPLPVHLALVGAFSIGTLVLAVLTSVRRTPRVAVNEQRIEIDSGGNPVDMFLQMRHAFEDIRLGDFPNRDILSEKPNLGRSREGETDSFSGELIVERQPEPMSRGLSINAMILDAAGAALRCAGFA